MSARALRYAIERKRTERRLRDILEAGPDAIVSVDEDGRITLVNSQAEMLFGYPREELLGQPLELLVPERLRGAHVALRENYARAPAARAMGSGFEALARRKDGTEVPVDVALGPVTTEHGTGVLAAVRDVTERKRRRAAVREAEERFRRAFDEAPIGMAMLDLDLRFVRVNEALCEITGYSREQLEATSLEAITHPDDLGEQEREIAGAACRRGRRLPVGEALRSRWSAARCGWRCRRPCCATPMLSPLRVPRPDPGHHRPPTLRGAAASTSLTTTR